MECQTKYCQSCEMPMTSKDLYGNDVDNYKSTAYCKYCYEKGVFISNVTMDEMIEICVPHMVGANSDISEDTARKMMQESFPKLKRWK